MILYNVTTGIDKELEKAWVHWMKNEHIPAVMRTGLFQHYKFYRVINRQEDAGASYSAQYFAQSMDDLHRYIHQHAPALRKAHEDKFGESQVSFRTILEEIH